MIKIANAPCSWGVLEFEIEGETIGYEQFLDELVETGYAGTELGDWDYMPTDPVRLREEIGTRGLDLVAAFVPVRLSERDKHQEGIEVGVKTARLMYDAGFDDSMIVLADDNGSVAERTRHAGRITPDLILDDTRWRNVIEGATRFAKTIRDETGLRTVFHHHCAGFIETPGELERLLAATPDDTLGLVVDMGHYLYAGGHPLSAIKLFWDRIWHIHYKDCSAEIAVQARTNGWDYFTAVHNGVFCELGRGTVGFAEITDEIRARGYEGWIVVEQDVLPGMGTPKACAGRNREFLRSLGL